MADEYQSWGHYPVASDQKVAPWRNRRRIPTPVDSPVLARGNGRSYGDVCLNEGGALLVTSSLDRFISFDDQAGELVCEPGVLLSEILALIVPRGWLLPVMPGTKLVTVGGAIANDVHGKNHHRFGTFGTNVLDFRLLRSDGSVLTCSRTENAELFAATIGGLGLTGLIAETRLKLRPIGSSYLEGEQIRFDTLDEFFALSEESEGSYEYTAAWIDCLASGDKLGRGHFMRANHAADGKLDIASPFPLVVPFTPPISLVNRLSLRVFNTLYYERQRKSRVQRRWHFNSHLFPLDSIAHWNRLYGPKGFLQYQCVVPMEEAQETSRALFAEIASSGQGSPLVVFKTFGDAASPGMLSFPMSGVTLALDFPILGQETFALLDRLDSLVREAGGRLYAAKDARMSHEMFAQGYPALEHFTAYIDPAFGSGFERRVLRGER